jgi:hypothetical protein
LAGGTGSGLGSKIISEIRDEYGKGSIMAASLAPFTGGETTVQNYNALLSLNSLANNVDFIGYFSNDQLLKCAQKNYVSSTHVQKQEALSLDCLNQYAARCLGGLLLPKTIISQTTIKTQISNLERFDINELIYSMTPMPSFKFCQFATSLSPEKKANLDSWEDIMTELLRNIPYDDNRSCFSSKLIIRGAQGPDIWKKLPKLTERWINKLGAAVSTLEPDVELSYIYGLDPNDKKRSFETCFNSKLILKEIDPIVEKAEMLLAQKAYLHWYRRYCSDIDQLFAEAVDKLHAIQDDYRLLSQF